MRIGSLVDDTGFGWIYFVSREKRKKKRKKEEEEEEEEDAEARHFLIYYVP